MFKILIIIPGFKVTMLYTCYYDNCLQRPMMFLQLFPKPIYYNNNLNWTFLYQLH